MKNDLVKEHIDVDIRYLKSGRIRLRFKLSDWAISIVIEAMKLTEYKHTHNALDILCGNFYDMNPENNKPNKNTHGNKRLLITLFPNQYKFIIDTFKIARKSVSSDAEALTMMSIMFIKIQNFQNNL